MPAPVEADSMPEAAAPPPFHLVIPAARVLTSEEELSMTRAALGRAPESAPLRLALAGLLVMKDHFDEAIDLLTAWGMEDFAFLSLHVLALLSRETEPANHEARRLSLKAFACATHDDQRAEALASYAKASIRLGEPEDARLRLEQALELNRADRDAYKRAAALDLLAQPERVMELAERHLQAGVTHSRVAASQSLALASMGRMEEARASQARELFFVELEPAPPEGWDSLADFNRQLAAELENHPDIRFSRYGTASSKTWRIDQPGLTRSHLLPVLQKLIQREVTAYVKALPTVGDHPFLQGRPAEAVLRNWCVLTEGDGHETWHVHQNGWLSGTYYVQVPDHIAAGTGKGGCIAFGLPEETIGPENAERFGEVLCRPRAGLMMMFPSHTYHRTYPHGGAGRRICYAFDIIAREPRPAGA